MGVKALYLRGGAVRGVYGGADVVSASVYAALEGFFGPDGVRGIYMDELEGRPGRLRSLSRALAGRFPLYAPAAYAELKRGLEDGASLLFVDQSVYGAACREAKALNPRCAVAALFHNDERRYLLRSALRGGAAAELLKLPSVTRAERDAMERADLAIALSGRDADELERDYGRRPELILPPMVPDRRPAPKAYREGEPRYLFVGSAFKPNVEAARFLARRVMPLVPGSLTVAGRGFDAYAAELGSARVRVLGFVEDLDGLYARADAVASPVPWGSGIKVKTAEAFMYGMPFVGSPEALEGYDAAAAGARTARSPADYAQALTELRDPEHYAAAAAAARSYYLRSLSPAAGGALLTDALRRILGDGIA